MGAKQKKRNNGILLQSIILASASVIVRLIGLVYRIPLTNIIGDEGNGFYSCAFEVYGLALLLSSLSLPLAVSKLVSARVKKGELKNAYRMFKGALYFALISGTIVCLILLFGGRLIAKEMMNLELSVYALRILAPGLIIIAVIGVIRGYLQGLGTMVPTALSQIIEQLVTLLVGLIGASYLFTYGKKIADAKDQELLGPAFGAAGGALGVVIGSLAAGMFFIFVLKALRGTLERQFAKDRSPKVDSYQKIFKVLAFTMIPIILSSSIYTISQVLDQGMFNHIMLVQGFSQKEYAALFGIYSGKCGLLINIPISVAGGIGASMVSNLAASVDSDIRLIHKRIHRAIRLGMLVVIPSFAVLVTLASPLMQLLFHDDRKAPASMLALGAITVVFYSLSTLLIAVLHGLSDLVTPIKNAAIALVIHLISLFLMLVMLEWGIYAVVVSNIIFAAILWYLNSQAVGRSAGYKQEKVKTFILPGFAAVIMGIITFAAHRLLDALLGGRPAAIWAMLIAAIVYSISLLLLGGVTETDIYQVPRGKILVKVFKKVHLLK